VLSLLSVVEGLGRFPTSPFAGAKDGSGYPLPMLAMKVLSPHQYNTGNDKKCSLSRAEIRKI